MKLSPFLVATAAPAMAALLADARARGAEHTAATIAAEVRRVVPLDRDGEDLLGQVLAALAAQFLGE